MQTKLSFATLRDTTIMAGQQTHYETTKPINYRPKPVSGKKEKKPQKRRKNNVVMKNVTYNFYLDFGKMCDPESASIKTTFHLK